MPKKHAPKLPHTRFGSMLKEFRIRRQLVLRVAAQLFNYNVCALSKVERGINYAPPLPTVRKWARLLNLTARQTSIFLARAKASKNEVSNELATDDDIVGSLPVFFISPRKITEKKLRALVQKIRELHTGDHVLARIAREKAAA